MAGIATAVVGVIIGLPTLRLRGDYLAIVTLGFGEILPQIARNGDNLFGTGFNLTNGTERHHADRRPGLRQLARQALRTCRRTSSPRGTSTRCSCGRASASS